MAVLAREPLHLLNKNALCQKTPFSSELIHKRSGPGLGQESPSVGGSGVRTLKLPIVL